MKILLASDSHNDDLTLKKIANKHNDCDYYLLCGDSQSNQENIRPFISVKGNCDYFTSDFPKYLILFSPLGKIYIEHIPFYTTNLSKLKKDGFKFYFTGHTHVKRNEIIEGIHFINPGSISYPRDDFASYAIVDIASNEVKVKFYHLDNDL